MAPEALAEKPSVAPQQAQPAAPHAHRAWWHKLAAATLLAACAVSIVECFFNFAGVGMEEILQPDQQFGTRHIPDKRFVWRMEGFCDDRFNSRGLRDIEHSIAKPHGVCRIALLGDSATESLQVPLAATYGAQLQQLFKRPGMQTEVINFGCSSYSTGQEVLQFEREVEAYKPDLTILLYNRGDAIENVRKATDYSCEPRPYFYLDNNDRLQEDDAVLAAYKNALQPNAVIDFLRRNSRIFGVLDQANLTLSIHEPLYRKLRGWLLFPFAAHKTRQQTIGMYAPQDALAVTTALIERLHSDCNRCGSKLVVVAFPNVVNDKELDQQIKSLSKTATTAGFGFVDLTPTFRWNPDPMSLFLQWHFSARGHKAVAEAINTYLTSRGGL